VKISIKKLNDNAIIPKIQSLGAAGADLHSIEAVTIKPCETKFVHTGIALSIPCGYGGFIFARSGLACKEDLAPANKVGVIDSDYRGEIIVALFNHGKCERKIEIGERIAQIVFLKKELPEFTEVEELDETVRGDGGFGSTSK